MVKEDKIYLMLSTLAILHEIPEPKNINTKIFEKILSPPVTAVSSPSLGTVISSQRDQVEVLITNNKTDFRDLSGNKDFLSRNTGRVVDFFVTEFKLKVNTYGVNFILRLPCEESKKWITENVLSPNITKKIGKPVLGDKVNISFKSGRKIYNVILDSHDEKNIEVNFNATEKVVKIPSGQALNKEFQKQWEFLLKLLSEFGL